MYAYAIKILMFGSIALGLLVQPISAFAYVQFFYQPKASEHAVTAGAEYRSLDTKFGLTDGSQSKSVIGRSQFEVQYDYGLIENLSIGAVAAYSLYSVESSSQFGRFSNNYSGLEDFAINLKGFVPIQSNFNFRFGIDYLASNEAKEDAESRTQNAFSGGDSLRPYIGLDYAVGSLFFGAKILREINLEDRVIKSPSRANGEVRLTGGEFTQASIFAESHQAWGILGGFLQHTITEDIIEKGTVFFDGANTITRDPSRSEQLSLTELTMYSVIPLAANIELLPRFGLGSTFQSSLGNDEGQPRTPINSLWIYQAYLGVRAIF